MPALTPVRWEPSPVKPRRRRSCCRSWRCCCRCPAGLNRWRYLSHSYSGSAGVVTQGGGIAARSGGVGPYGSGQVARSCGAGAQGGGSLRSRRRPWRDRPKRQSCAIAGSGGTGTCCYETACPPSRKRKDRFRCRTGNTRIRSQRCCCWRCRGWSGRCRCLRKSRQ